MLQFLRTKKFSTDAALTLLENHLMFLQKHPKWFSCDVNQRNKRLEEYCDSKVIIPLIQRDDKGRKGIFIQVKNINAETINYTDLYSLCYEIGFCFLEDEETQIAGMFLVVDFCEKLSLNLLSRFSVVDFKEIAESVNDSLAGRFKGLFLINVPPAAQFLLEILKLVFSKKKQDRIFILKDHDELKQHFDIKIMPKELGGEIPEAEMIDEFRGMMEQNEEALKLRYNFEIDLAEMSNFEKPGSFRTLNID